jgi:hypothetical protein
MTVMKLRDDELLWMRHTDPEHAGWFQCPAAAVEAFRARGWELAEGDPPPEPNPAVAELAAFQAEQAKAEAAKPAKKAAKSTTSATRDDEEKE